MYSMTIDEIGNKYGKLIVESREGTRGSKATWNCKCDCGQTRVVSGDLLRRGKTKSCGCKRGGRRYTLPIGQASFNGALDRAIRSAQKRGYSWNLTSEQFKIITTKICYYCGELPKARQYKPTNGDYFHNGIDRINNSVGYQVDNCVACCTKCNYAKHTMTQKEFISMAHKISKRHSTILVAG